MTNPIIVGITGGSGSGKTLFLNKLLEKFQAEEISLLSLDNYYKPIKEQPRDASGVENFDLPESIDRARFLSDLTVLKNGQDISITEYTFNNTEKEPSQLHIKSSPIIVAEGIFTFYFEEILELLDLKIYVDAPDYLMLSRRIKRDAEERGYDLSDVLYRFQHHVMPSYNKYIEPLKHKADLIIPNHDGFSKALDVVSIYLKQNL